MTTAQRQETASLVGGPHHGEEVSIRGLYFECSCTDGGTHLYIWDYITPYDRATVYGKWVDPSDKCPTCGAQR